MLILYIHFLCLSSLALKIKTNSAIYSRSQGHCNTLRFAQFFVTPLFTEGGVDREVNAVNSEHEKNIQNDYWRLAQLEKSTADPTHDFSKFGTGELVDADSADGDGSGAVTS